MGQVTMSVAPKWTRLFNQECSFCTIDSDWAVPALLPVLFVNRVVQLFKWKCSNESTTGADASVEVPKLHNIKLLIAGIFQRYKCLWFTLIKHLPPTFIRTNLISHAAERLLFLENYIHESFCENFYADQASTVNIYTHKFNIACCRKAAIPWKLHPRIILQKILTHYNYHDEHFCITHAGRIHTESQGKSKSR